MEEWRDVIGYDGKYQVSNLGNVRNNKGLILKQSEWKGYVRVYLNVHDVKRVHRLVADAFIDNPNKLSFINHKDEDAKNNCVDNLEWCTREYNNNYGTRNKRIGEKLSKKVLCIELNKTYNSLMDAQRELGVSSGHISQAIAGKGRRKTTGGYHWKYINSEVEE